MDIERELAAELWCYRRKAGKGRPGEQADRPVTKEPTPNEKTSLSTAYTSKQPPISSTRALPSSLGFGRSPARLPRPWWQPREEPWRPFPSVRSCGEEAGSRGAAAEVSRGPGRGRGPAPRGGAELRPGAACVAGSPQAEGGSAGPGRAPVVPAFGRLKPEAHEV